MSTHRRPANGEDDLRLAASVARRHYLGGESKVEIAGALGLSRFKVARLIDLAHEAGLVRIEVRDPGGAGAELVDRLRSRFGLRYVAVVPTATTAPGVRSEIGETAARLLCGALGAQDVLGLPWSRSVHDMVNALQSMGTALPPVEIIQLSGALAFGSDDSSTVDVVRRAARTAGGGRQVFFAPLIMPDAEAAAAVRRDPAVHETLGAASRVTVAVVGVGAWMPGQSTIYDAVDEATRVAVAQAGGIGDAAGLIFDASGRPVQTPLSDRIIALRPQDLLAIPNVIAVAHGPAKVTALSAAIEGGLVQGLVTTQDTAEALLG